MKWSKSSFAVWLCSLFVVLSGFNWIAGWVSQLALNNFLVLAALLLWAVALLATVRQQGLRGAWHLLSIVVIVTPFALLVWAMMNSQV